MSRSRRWRTRNIEERKEARAIATMTAPTLEPTRDYSAWTTEKLIRRVTELEAALKKKTLEAREFVFHLSFLKATY